MNLIEVTKSFPDDETCLAYLEAVRWPKGVRCVKCESQQISRITRHSTKENKRTKLYQCLRCGEQFSATSGTIFHDSHLPLRKWFIAVALFLNAKKGLSAKQMQRDLGVAYRTAWYLCHRIRKALEDGDLPKLTGTVEVDETYVGGKYDKRRKRDPWTKAPVMGIIQRKGRVEAYSIPTPSKAVLVGKIKDRVAPEAEMVVTDEYRAYASLKKTYRHEVVNHIKQWVRAGRIHTNTIENFWSLFKRGLIGSFHKVSVKHLPRYLDEFTYRFNNRETANLFTLTLGRLLGTINMPYKELVAGS